MLLTYKFFTKFNSQISFLCQISNNLYNQANFIIKQELKNSHKWIRYKELNDIMKEIKNLEGEINYRLLKAQTSQQILRILDKNWNSYFKSLKQYKKNPNKFKNKPNPPSFLKKNSEYNLVFTNQNSSIKNEYLILNKNLKIFIPQFEKYKNKIKKYKQVRILPRKKTYVVEVIYDYEQENNDLDYNRYGSIDFGVDNLITLISCNQQPLLYSGSICKSINQLYNKESSKLKSIRDKSKRERRNLNDKKLKKLLLYRNNCIMNHFQKISRHVVNYLTKNKIGNLVIGLNRNWKDSISIGKKNNQNFLFLPHSKLFYLIKYKCNMAGIKIIEQEESYTSKCDSLTKEPINKHKIYLGKRIKRGLFQSSTKKLVNADVNGALNILRKVLDDSHCCINEIINRGFLFNPVKVRTI